MGTGVDLAESPLLNEGSGTSRNTQTAGRFAHHKLHRFAVVTTKDKTEWITVVKTLEDALVLYQHQPNSLAKTHWRYLHDRTGGSISALHTLIRRAAIRAVRTGTEAVTRDLLDTITLSFTSQREYAKVVDMRAQETATNREGAGRR